ncbi:MAG: oligosaccharide flippase family protein [Clostridia bacterium]|nr:oligosaccharide flippase family protein [Clostridia bacterium]
MRNFFKTVAIVTVFSICEKALGFLYRIFLSHTIGAEGIGLYQVALSVFGTILTLTTAGTPVTVSRLMTKYNAENHPDRAKRVITAGLSITLIIILPVTLFLFIFADHLGFLFADARCIPLFRTLLPGLVFTSIYSVLRGVFWGSKDFLPYSIIELLEEACMILVGIALITFSTDVFTGAFGASVAVLISYVFSFTLATITFFVRKNRFANPKSEFKPLLRSAIPITAMRSASSLAVSLVSVILPARLIAHGLTESQAMSSFGAIMGQAIPILFIPTTLIGSFTLVLVPEISENYYKKRFYYLKRDVEKAIKFSCFLTCIFVPVFTICGSEIGLLIFNGHECGRYLSTSAYLMLFMSLSSVTTSMLNSMGMENRTLLYFILSSALMLICIWFLPSLIGVYALLVGFTLVYGVTTLLNLKLLNERCAEKPKYLKFIISSALICLPTCILGALTEKLLLPLLGTLLTFFICAALMIIFHLLLYFGFNLVSIELIKTKGKKIFTRTKKIKNA